MYLTANTTIEQLKLFGYRYAKDYMNLAATIIEASDIQFDSDTITMDTIVAVNQLIEDLQEAQRQLCINLDPKDFKITFNNCTFRVIHNSAMRNAVMVELKYQMYNSYAFTRNMMHARQLPPFDLIAIDWEKTIDNVINGSPIEYGEMFAFEDNVHRSTECGNWNLFLQYRV